MNERPGLQAGRTMREVTPRELEEAIEQLLHEKTNNCYTVKIDALSFTKDPNAFDSGQFAARFERDISGERHSIDEIVESFFEE
ncbi:MAG TPA: hypothetical protein VFP71_00070 [Candidatus Angelobacter sp.]|nr:hypothetical protein [Candidatus Angelobacter sp.]